MKAMDNVRRAPASAARIVARSCRSKEKTRTSTPWSCRPDSIRCTVMELPEPTGSSRSDERQDHGVRASLIVGTDL